MSCSFSFHFCRIPLPQSSRNPSISIVSRQKISLSLKLKSQADDNLQPIKTFGKAISTLAIHFGAAWATVAEPAVAVTGMTYEDEDIVWILIQLGISAFIYFLVVPPIVMNWMRVRWYRRSLGEMYLQFMFVFMFFPGLLLWAPFLNFRKLPRDPDMKNPWDRPKDPSLIKSEYRKYPWASPEDYD